MSAQAIPSNTEASILVRILQADEREITPDVARYLLSMRLPDEDEQRMNELSSKHALDLSAPTRRRNLIAIYTLECNLRWPSVLNPAGPISSYC